MWTEFAPLFLPSIYVTIFCFFQFFLLLVVVVVCAICSVECGKMRIMCGDEQRKNFAWHLMASRRPVRKFIWSPPSLLLMGFHLKIDKFCALSFIEWSSRWLDRLPNQHEEWTAACLIYYIIFQWGAYTACLSLACPMFRWSFFARARIKNRRPFANKKKKNETETNKSTHSHFGA